ncbi:MAG: S-layer homology domain-containing protein [Candidatus Peribacteraceae bacterium]|jgi:plastocyanin
MKARSHSIVYLALLAFPLTVAAQLLVTVEGQQVTLRDVPPNAWYSTYVRDAVSSDIMSGYRDAQGNLLGLFGPADNITVAETLKISVEGAGYDVEAYGQIPATLSGHWAGKYLHVAAEERFRLFERQQNVDRPSTRAEVASMFTDAFMVDTITPVGNRYDDVGFATPYAYSIEALSRDGILTGDTDGSGKPLGRFRPNEPINRAEATKMIMKARAVYGMPAQTSSASSSRISSSSATSSRSSASSSSSLSSASSLSSTGSVSSSSTSSVSSVIQAMVTLRDAGFSPQTITVNSGATVMFLNDSTGTMWVASDPHPQHTDYPGFDQTASVPRDGSYTFTFGKTGTWGYHNHVSAGMTGAVIVQ